MSIQIKLDSASSKALFQQIVDEIEALIISGNLVEGESIPSVRDFAVLHSVNPNTVSKAYQILQSKNLIEPVRGIGLKVCKLKSKFVLQRRAEILNAEVDHLVSVAKTLRSTPADLTRLIQARWSQGESQSQAQSKAQNEAQDKERQVG